MQCLLVPHRQTDKFRYFTVVSMLKSGGFCRATGSFDGIVNVKLHFRGHARSRIEQAHPDGLIERIERHFAIGRPLAADHGDQISVLDHDGVLARDRLGRFRCARREQRPQSCEGRQHVGRRRRRLQVATRGIDE